jgi:cytochrome c-type biogenesis protein CcmH
MKRCIFILFACLLSFQTLAAIDTWQFKNEAQEQQFRQITEQLRCPKCQNNNIADSNAMIAADMRQKVYELMQQGESREQIIDYMVARYGNFVTYEPPVTPSTLILWILPALFALGGGLVIFRRSRRSRRMVTEESATFHADAEVAEEDDNPQQPEISGMWPYLLGGIAFIVLSLGMFMKTSSVLPVLEWRKVTEQTPQLLQRVMNPKSAPLTIEEIARLRLGLRSQLQDAPDDLHGWLMLGRISQVLNDPQEMKQAYERALQLSPRSTEARMGYAEVLTRSANPQDVAQAGEILKGLLKENHSDPDILNLAAFNAYAQDNYAEAIAAWKVMLQLVPADDPRRAVILRSIQQAEQQLSALGK